VRWFDLEFMLLQWSALRLTRWGNHTGGCAVPNADPDPQSFPGPMQISAKGRIDQTTWSLSPLICSTTGKGTEKFSQQGYEAADRDEAHGIGSL
jgi:hypothetical protein